MVEEKHIKEREKYSNNKNNPNNISNAEDIITNKPYRHQQHMPKLSQNVSKAVQTAIRYGRNTSPVR